jgi:hypothetical protein
MEKFKMWDEEQSKMSLMNGQKLVEQWEIHHLEKARVKQKQVLCQYKLRKDKEDSLSSIGSLPSIMTG